MQITNKDIQSEQIRQQIREQLTEELKSVLSAKQIQKVVFTYNKEESDMGIYKRRDNINLTEQEYEIYLFLIKYFKENGYAPTVREIGKGVYLSSTATIKYYLDALERKKKIKRGSSARAICLTEYTLVHKKRVR